MLLELNISDFAIIDRLNLRLADGFNVLTGETGAGKSIIIDALGTLRGERTDPTFVRAGTERARIEGVFSVDDRPDVVPLLEEYGLWDGEDDQVILSREINRESGRSVARINGRAVSSVVLREIGSRLVDIHGQHEGLSLFNTRTHGDMLDRYGGLVSLREQVAEQVARLRRVREELQALRSAAASRAERIEELRFLLEDVEAAKLHAGEEDELIRERALVQNGARITDLVVSTYITLYGGEESGRKSARPVIEALGAVSTALAELARLDPNLARTAEQAGELLYAAEDLAASVRTYRDAMEFDSSRLDAIEDRLTLIRDMQRKYRAPIEQILERAASASAEIERLTNSEEHLAELEAEENRLRAAVGRLAGELSARRRTIGDELAEAVVAAVRDLAMPHVRFYVSLTQEEDPEGVPVADLPLNDLRLDDLRLGIAEQKRAPSQPTATADADNRQSSIVNRQSSIVNHQLVAFDKTGIDKIEFLLSPNPGEPLKPLARIASGGESARLLLALKSILSRVDEVPTLIFDEVDVGVGGRAGQVVGEKLWSISEQHQVICITHLPQVAAFGDAHYAIAKLVSDNRTRTAIQMLSNEQRTEEIAAMLDGVPVREHSRQSAREMLDRAHAFKQRSGREAAQRAFVQ
jgi:DNA repair protein RecN (Recombination protein N)